jgi:hypothetical protein
VGATGAPVVAGLIDAAAQRIRHRWSANAGKAVAHAADVAGLNPQELLDRLLSAPNRQELLASALQAAAHATVEGKIKALAAALKTGALTGAEAEVDHELLFVRAMADFEAAHITVLSHLAQRAAFASGGSSPLDAIAQLPGVGSAAAPVIATLERHGAIESVPLDIHRLFGEFYDNMPGEPIPSTPLPSLRPRGSVPSTPPRTWRITSFGEECWARLQGAGDSVGH